MAILGISGFIWLFSTNTPWQTLAKIYRTERGVPGTFLIAKNQRISLRNINTSGSLALTSLGIGVLDDGLYLSDSSFLLLSDKFFPTLLIPWTDITYRRITTRNFSHREYYTFDLGNPKIVSFSLKADMVEQLEQNYGESIFLKKLGEPD